MGIHFSNGRILLQNITDNNWYYLDVGLNDAGLPALRPAQIIAFNNGEVDYDPYVLIRANNGIVYKLGLLTNGDGKNDYSWVEADLPFEFRVINLFLKNSDTGLLYRVQGLIDEGDGEIRVNVSFASEAIAAGETLNVPCNCPTEASIMTPDVVLQPAGVLEECAVLVPEKPTLPTYLVGSGRGEKITGTDGEKILSSH